MSGAMTSCPMGRRGVLVTKPCRGRLHSGIPLYQEATVRKSLARGASSSLELLQRVSGVWLLSATNNLTLNQDSDRQRLITPSAESPLLIDDHNCAAGGRIIEDEGIDIFDVDSLIATNKQVTLSSKPLDGSEDVFINGLLATPGITRDYTLVDDQVIFNNTWDLRIGDLITVKYET